MDDRKQWEAEETELPRLADDPSSGSKVAEARLLAAGCVSWSTRARTPAEIVVLLRAFTHVAAIERALGDAGLDPYVVGGRGFWSQQQIEDLRCLLAVIANPLEDEALFGALASPACGVLPDTLWLLRRARSRRGRGRPRARGTSGRSMRDLVEGGEPQRGDAEAAALIPAEELERLRALRADPGRAAPTRDRGWPGDAGGRVATAFGYDLATLTREDGTARWANVRKLMRLAREFEAREGPDLGGIPRLSRQPRASSATARPRPRPGPRATPESG